LEYSETFFFSEMKIFKNKFIYLFIYLFIILGTCARAALVLWYKEPPLAKSGSNPLQRPGPPPQKKGLEENLPPLTPSTPGRKDGW
jgi:hypothetical protein